MGSSAFYEAAAADPDRYPEWEEAYRQSMYSPLRQVDRMGLYGKWIYGELMRSPNLNARAGNLYRQFRKAHWGWPYGWVQFARSTGLGGSAPVAF